MEYLRFLKRVSDEILRDFSSLGNPILLILLFLLALKEKQLKNSIIGLLIVIAVCYSIKTMFNKERPNKVPHKNFLELIQARSFPSIHSAEIMYSALVLIKNINNALVDTLFVIIILTVGYSRYYLKKHYLTDIISGYIIGFIVYFLLFYILKLTT